MNLKRFTLRVGVLSAFLMGCSEPPPTAPADQTINDPLLNGAKSVGPSVYGMGRLNRSQPRSVCNTASHREFDFWVGRWDVFGPAGGQSGTNEIRVLLDGCLVEESWVGAGGGPGRSMNAYDATTDTWSQYWIAPGIGTSLHLRLEGRMDGGVMTMSGPRTGFRPDGTPVPIVDRFRWTPDPDGTVNQFWDISLDQGDTFPIVAFNGTYVANADIDPAPISSVGCTGDNRHRQLDFLEGVWAVETPTGQTLGESKVVTDLAGCLVEEDFATPKGYRSQSFFGWDFRTEKWYRNLVDTDGTRLRLEGALDRGAMVLTGTRTTPAGPVSLRQVLEPLGPNLVRQVWSTSRNGSAWQPSGEVFFVR